MPKLWDETIEAHRESVRDATLQATAELVAEYGLRGVTMSAIAEAAGIGRATLYKYFPDVETIIATWHEGQVSEHLAQLGEVRDNAGPPAERLEAVLTAYAHIQRGRMSHPHTHGAELDALVHMGEHAAHARGKLHGMIRDLIFDAVGTGDVRDDIAPEELAAYCIHALEAAGHTPAEDSIPRLVSLTRAGLRPQT